LPVKLKCSSANIDCSLKAPLHTPHTHHIHTHNPCNQLHTQQFADKWQTAAVQEPHVANSSYLHTNNSITQLQTVATDRLPLTWHHQHRTHRTTVIRNRIRQFHSSLRFLIREDGGERDLTGYGWFSVLSRGFLRSGLRTPNAGYQEQTQTQLQTCWPGLFGSWLGPVLLFLCQLQLPDNDCS